jgi:uncharacterized repeat protein (TIGR01451 family)
MGSNGGERRWAERGGGRSHGRRPLPRVPSSRLLVCALAVFAALLTSASRTGAAATWSIVGSQQPFSLHGISCTTPLACAAVGNTGQYPFTTGAAASDALTWSNVSSPNPSTTYNFLQGVSCVSTNMCTAVGYYNAPQNGSGYWQTLVESWNGSAWSVVPSPNTSASQDNYLFGVSCVSAFSCVAVGYYENRVTAFDGTLAESWDGSHWTIVPTSAPSAQPGWLDGVSCSSVSACIAVGRTYDGVNYQTLVLSWDGTAWSVVASPNQVSADNYLEAVSCVNANTCTAVGYSAPGGTGSLGTLIESVSGSAWSIVPSPNGPDGAGQLFAVSCVAASACTAAGRGFGVQFVGLVEVWNGATWSAASVPTPPSQAGGVEFWGVSCVSANVCTAVGDNFCQDAKGCPTTVSSIVATSAASPGPGTSLSIALSSCCNNTFIQGQVGATYNAVVTNIGAYPTSGPVTVTEMAPPGLTLTAMSGAGWSCAPTACSRSDTLAADSSYPPITVTVNVGANAPTGPNAVTDRVTVIGGGDPNGPHTALASDTVSGVAGPAPTPSLTIAKSHSGNFSQGQTGAPYTITVANTAGAGPTSGVVTVTDNAPPGVTVASMSGSGWTCSVMSCTRSDPLAGGAGYAPITVTANVAANAPVGANALTNRASVSGGGDPSGPHTAADPTTITGAPSPATPAALSIAKSHSGSFTQGQSGSYTVTVANAAGSGATSGVVTVTDNAPPGLAVASMSGSGWSCSVMSCTRSDALAGGASYPPITVTVNVAANASWGTNAVTNHASVTGGGDPSAPHTAADPTTIEPSP